jgi:hypothetical protein
MSVCVNICVLMKREDRERRERERMGVRSDLGVEDGCGCLGAAIACVRLEAATNALRACF